MPKLVWDTYKISPGTYRIILLSGKNEIEKEALVTEKLLWPAGNKSNNFSE